MQRLDDLAAFVAVVREGSFTRAAAQLGVSQPALSHTVRMLEQRMNAKLLHRTTRSLAPTQAGQRLYDGVAPRLDEIARTLASVDDLRGAVSGTVRISASENAVDLVVWPRLSPWLAQYPEVVLDIQADNRFVDIVAERVDIGVRLGNDVAKDMIAVCISPEVRMVTVASPAYLQQHAKPNVPANVTAHSCIAMRLPTHGGLLGWEFERRGRKLTVRVTPRVVLNRASDVLTAACDGHGLAWLPQEVAREDVAAGHLTTVLDAWSARYPGYHAYYPSRNASAATMAVVQALRGG